MKLKQRPDDFQVEELTDLTPTPVGEFGLYRLDKSGWTTPDALDVVRLHWKADRARMSFGGLKDRHATTSQFFTLHRGPAKGLKSDGVVVTYLGRCAAPFTSDDIRANRFAVTLRDLGPPAVERADAALREVADVGVPNYFDDQRFGSVGAGGEFVGREMVFGRFDRALWLALAEPYEFDRAEAKREKAVLRATWNDWPTAVARLPHGHARTLAQHLAANPSDLRGAIARLRPELQGLYLAAYQSFLWNRMLGLWVQRNVPPADVTRIDLQLGPAPVPRRLPPELRERWEALTLPLPSARIKADADAEWSALAAEVLATEGLTLRELQVKGMHKPFFSKGDRAGCVRPANLRHAAAPDDFHPGRHKLVLRFDLPKGSYATMLVKRVTATCGTG